MAIGKATLELMAKADSHYAASKEASQELVMRPAAEYFSAMDKLRATLDLIANTSPNQAESVWESVKAIETEWAESLRISVNANDHLMSATSIQREINQKLERGRGGDRRWANDSKSGWKVEAQSLWPEANRKGWTASQFHRALVDAGQKISFETARKGLTALRKTGKC